MTHWGCFLVFRCRTPHGPHTKVAGLHLSFLWLPRNLSSGCKWSDMQVCLSSLSFCSFFKNESIITNKCFSQGVFMLGITAHCWRGFVRESNNATSGWWRTLWGPLFQPITVWCSGTSRITTWWITCWHISTHLPSWIARWAVGKLKPGRYLPLRAAEWDVFEWGNIYIAGLILNIKTYRHRNITI